MDANQSGETFHMKGNFAPVGAEVEAIDLAVDGAIPAELDGLYVRNGPNPKSGDPGHWFFGDGMLNGVRLKAGRALWFRNRWVRTKVFDGANRLAPENILDCTVSSANTNIIQHAGRLFALEEGAFPTQVQADLSTVGPYDFNGRLTTSFTAHPKICPETGEMHGFGYGFAPPFLTYHHIDASGALVRSLEIPVSGPTMHHDFVMTRRHVIFMDLPVVFDVMIAIKGGMPFRWSDDYGARLLILPRGGGIEELRTVTVAPCYVFHPANAYEEADGTLVIDTVRYPELWRHRSRFAAEDAAHLHRWRIPPGADRAQEEQLSDRLVEFPRINERRAGLAARYTYMAAMSPGQPKLGFSRVAKHDALTGELEEHEFGPGRLVSEFTFVPAGSGEDHGYLMGFVFDAATERSDLVLLDAQNPSAAAIARVRLPQRVPQGFHGCFVPANAVGMA